MARTGLVRGRGGSGMLRGGRRLASGRAVTHRYVRLVIRDRASGSVPTSWLRSRRLREKRKCAVRGADA